MVDSATAARVP